MREILISCFAEMNLIITKLMSSIKQNSRTTLAPISNANDVSFSIPEWKNQEIQSLHHGYEKDIYISVPLSLTDFDSHEEVEFLSKPQKPKTEAYAYERQLINREDFGILSFIVCMQQTIIAEENSKANSTDFLKKRVNDLNLCVFEDVPAKFRRHYENKVLKKILFQYINKGSYNVSLLEILLRKNHVLKFALSLISKALLKRSGLIEKYNERVDNFIEMKVCGEYFRILSMIKVRDKFVDSENFYISMNQDSVKIFRKQNVIKNSANKEKRTRSSSVKKRRESTKTEKKPSTHDKKESKAEQKESKDMKRSSSLMNLIKKIICY